MTLRKTAPVKNVFDEGISDSKTDIDISGNIAALTAFDVTASGVNYTKSGDDGNLGLSAAVFNSSIGTRVELNGVNQEKSTQAVRVSATTFTLSTETFSGDIIRIYS